MMTHNPTPLLPRLCLLLALLFAPLQAALGQEERPVIVFAAASLKTVLDEVVAGFDGAPVVVSYGGSGAQARQIAAGAPADLVLLASTDWADWLTARALLLPKSRVNLLGNRLVLAGEITAPPLPTPLTAQTLLDRLGGNPLILGDRHGVPAGFYAHAWLQQTGLAEALEARLAYADNVRAALAHVARAEAPLAVVYATDPDAKTGTKILYDIPSTLHPPIVYPLAQLHHPRPHSQTAPLARYLQSPAALSVFERAGFVPLSPKPSMQGAKPQKNDG